MMWLFYSLACLVLWQSLMSLLGGVRYLAYMSGEMHGKQPDFSPFTSIIVPCRGLDPNLRLNLSALFKQNYPAYEIIFVLDHADDPARAVVDEVRRGFDGSKAQTCLVIAGAAEGCGQKVHNLRVGVSEADSRSEVLVFVDTDARPSEDWLRSLVAPLADKRLGAATGYRWFLTVKGGLASHLRSVWNASIASALGGNNQRNFCWGGSTAIRRETFDRIDMLNKWRGTLSDDFALTAALREAQLPIQFVPQCLTASHEDCSFAELLEFTTRQIKITRVYAAHLWKIVLWSNLIFVSVFFGGLILSVTRAALGLPYRTTLLFVVAIYCLGAAKAALRLYAVSLPLSAHGTQLRRSLPFHLLLWPLTAALYLYNALAALRSQRITWRGITYELKSKTETAIIHQPESDQTAKLQKVPYAS